MAKTFLKWLAKEIIAPIFVDAVKKTIEAVLDKSSFRYSGKRFQYAYNCSF